MSLTAVPPAVVGLLLALAVMRLPRRAAFGTGVAGSLAILGWLLAVPAGDHLAVPLFGFDAVLFAVDGYARLLGVTFAFVAAVTTAYGYATGADRRRAAYALVYVSSGLGAVFAGDWLTLVVWWEALALAATLLLWHRATDRGVGVRYAIYHEIGGLVLIAGVLLHYAHAGTFLYGDGVTAGLPALLVALGIGLNAGFVGLHVWVVDAYPNTHVATSVVLAAVTTKVGAYTLLRAFPAGQRLVAYVGGAMVLYGVTFAILQTDMRKLLSYHIVSQVGYIVAGVGAGTPLAAAGAMSHLVNNVLYKSLLFVVAGLLVVRTGAESLKKVDVDGRSAPLLFGGFVVAALSITGFPGFNGFVSKAMVVDGVEKAGLDALWWVLVVGGVGTVISFAKFGYYAFLHGEGEVADLGTVEGVVVASLAVPCLLVGLAPDLVFGFLPAKAVAYAKPFAGKQFVKAGTVLAVGLVAFALIRAPLSHVTPVRDLGAVYGPAGRWLVEASTRTTAAVEVGLTRVRSTVIRAFGGRAEHPRSATVGRGVLAVAVVFAVVLAAFLL